MSKPIHLLTYIKKRMRKYFNNKKITLKDIEDMDRLCSFTEAGKANLDFFRAHGLRADIYVSEIRAKPSRSSKPKTRFRTGHYATSRNKTSRKDTHVS